MHSIPGRRAHAGHRPHVLRKRSTAAMLAMLLSCVAAGTQAASWERAAQVVYVDDSSSPVETHEVSAALDYAIAAWSARLDTGLQRSDAEVTSGYNAGIVTIRWVDVLDMVRDGSDILSAATTRRWLYLASGAIAGAEIFLARDNPRLQDSACLTHVLLHELGHALGLTHLAAENAVMHPGLGSCHHTLTFDDVAAAPYPQHPCHAELLPNRDLYLPVVRVGEKSWSVRMAYEQDHWVVSDTRPVAAPPECDSAWLDADTLVLEKVWTQHRTWQAELGKSGEAWHLKGVR